MRFLFVRSERGLGADPKVRSRGPELMRRLLVSLALLCGAGAGVACSPVGVNDSGEAAWGCKPGASVRAGALSFQAAWLQGGAASYLVLTVTNVGTKDVMIARRPDEYSARYVYRAKKGGQPDELFALRRYAGGPGKEPRVFQLEYKPDYFVILGPKDSLTRWYKHSAVEGVQGIRDLTLRYYMYGGADFRNKPFEGEVVIPEVPSDFPISGAL